MYTTDARKLRLIDELLKIKSDTVLAKIEKLLKGSVESAKDVPELNIHDFVGILSDKEARIMKEAIAGSCETIDEDVWK